MTPVMSDNAGKIALGAVVVAGGVYLLTRKTDAAPTAPPGPSPSATPSVAQVMAAASYDLLTTYLDIAYTAWINQSITERTYRAIESAYTQRWVELQAGQAPGEAPAPTAPFALTVAQVMAANTFNLLNDYVDIAYEAWIAGTINESTYRAIEDAYTQRWVELQADPAPPPGQQPEPVPAPTPEPTPLSITVDQIMAAGTVVELDALLATAIATVSGILLEDIRDAYEVRYYQLTGNGGTPAPSPTGIPTKAQILAADTTDLLSQFYEIITNAYQGGDISYSAYLDLYNAYQQRWSQVA